MKKLIARRHHAIAKARDNQNIRLVGDVLLITAISTIAWML